MASFTELLAYEARNNHTSASRLVAAERSLHLNCKSLTKVDTRSKSFKAGANLPNACANSSRLSISTFFAALMLSAL
ncbi:hypothetical protein D3C76_1548650 [compost metagenome]